jgi:hypothetical protein
MFIRGSPPPEESQNPSGKPQGGALSQGAHLTPRDLDILDALTKRVRVLTLPQVARTWWAVSKNPIENARNRLQILKTNTLVQIQRVPAHPELLLEEPVSTWTPGAAPPDFGAVSYLLQTRWNRPTVSTVCISATTKAANRLGGHGGRFPREVERTHDIHLARVYLCFKDRSPSLLQGWIFEEALRQEHRRSSERLPDVIIRNGTHQRVIEFGGAYPKVKLEAFHGYCKEKAFPYEIW